MNISKYLLLPTFLTFIYFFSTPANSMGLSNYIENKDNPELKQFFLTHISGVGDGIFWSNAFAESRYGKAFFCSPAKMVLEPQNYVTILNRLIESGYKVETDSVGFALFIGLVKTFPCESN